MREEIRPFRTKYHLFRSPLLEKIEGLRHVVAGRPIDSDTTPLHEQQHDPAAAVGWEDTPATFLLRQRHTAHVVDASDETISPPEADGVVDRAGHRLLRVITADCIPLFLVDRASPAAALVHAGWRGLAAGVVEAALARLFRAGVGAHDLVAWIGPSIGPCCYEVGDDVVEAFSGAAVTAGGDGAPVALDLYATARGILLRAGLRGDSVEKRPQCTKCGRHVLYSHRAGASGRNVALLHTAG